MRFFAGSIGFNYPEWDGVHCPTGLPARQRLAYYAKRLPTVELSIELEKPPLDEELSRLSAQVPEHFSLRSLYGCPPNLG